MTPEQARDLVVAREVAPETVVVPGRTEACPLCGVKACYGPRSFGEGPPTYYLCKWCGFRGALRALAGIIRERRHKPSKRPRRRSRPLTDTGPAKRLLRLGTSTLRLGLI